MMAGVISDEELDQLKERLGNNTKLRSLGTHLKMKRADIDMFLEMNYSGGKVTSRGTGELLGQWADNYTPKNQKRRVLKEALEKAGLAAIAEEILGNDSPSTVDTSGTAGNRAGSSGPGINQVGATINVNFTGGTTPGNINIIGQQATINRP